MKITLIKNAVEAMPDKGGVLSILTLKIKENIVVKITDTGEGISEENLEKIFEPLFTTKTDDKNSHIVGTGLGLPFCKKVIEAYKGTLLVESELGKGTTFSIILPLNEKIEHNDL